jgi:serine/threonine protein kinase
MAPEILKQKPYNGAVDYWALGCTVYDLIVGDVRAFATRGSCDIHLKFF